MGGFGAIVGDVEVPRSAWRLRRATKLVKLLALAPERSLHRERLADALWPDDPEGGAGLHQVLYTARRALAPDGAQRELITLVDDVVALVPDIAVDVEWFLEAAERARSCREQTAHRDAIALYAGELLPEDRYEDWTTAQRASLQETYLRLLVELGAMLAGDGDAAGAVEILQRAIVADPLHEPAHRALMRTFAQDGRVQQALAQYQQLSGALAEQLAADPDPETRELYVQILGSQHHRPDSDADRLAGPVPGEEAPRSRSAGSRLPHQTTSFIGRENELAALEQMLPRTRLLTLTGPGGAGKTRLALALAARAEPTFDEPAYLVELAPVSNSARITGELAAALGLQPRSERDPFELLRSQIAARRLLIVIDNCEHLIDATAALADRLLRACPGLVLLATSRERLRVAGETAWRVPPLSLPRSREDITAADLEPFEAVTLFCRRAAEAAPGFELTDETAPSVAEICHRLDGMPLALELAAAHAAMLSPAQISERLSDALGLLAGGSRTGLTRQQTLRATLEWSHALLDEDEGLLYRRLGIFSGSFELDDVEQVCGGDGGASVLDAFRGLVDKSLVQVEAGQPAHRYRLLETMRQDARERLGIARETDELERRHREWYASLARTLDRDLDPHVDAATAERLEAEHDNMRAALASGIRHAPSSALDLACSLWWFWMARGHFSEALRWLDAALAAAPERTAARARALLCAGAVCVRTGSLKRITGYGLQAYEIVRHSGSPHAEARALERLGAMGLGGWQGHLADDAYARGLALAEALDDAAVTVAILQAQGVLAGCRGDQAHARELLGRTLELLADIPEESGPLFWAARISPVVIPAGPNGEPRFFFEDTFCLFRAVCSRAAAGYVLFNVAEAWRAEGRYEEARGCLEDSLARFDDLADEQGIGGAFSALGNLARSTGDHAAGHEHLGRALEIRRSLGDSREIALTLTNIGMLALSSGDRERGEALLEDALHIYERTDDAPGMESIPANLGWFVLDSGDPERACGLFERSIELCTQRGVVHRSRGWSAVGLAESALSAGQLDRSENALAMAEKGFSEFKERHGLAHAGNLRDELRAARR